MRIAIVRIHWNVLVNSTTLELPTTDDIPILPAILGTVIYEDDKLRVHTDGVGDPPPGFKWVAPAQIADDYACNIISNLAM